MAKDKEYINGTMPFVGGWNRALSATEILALYENPFAMFRPFRKKSLLWLIWSEVKRIANIRIEL